MAAPAASDAHRDPRLDFFRGLGMFIILIAHTPWNGWNNWIPARFGYSDATEIFVFCSGAASAIAFMKVFEKRGWPIGTARVGYRIYQIYWSHVGLFLATATALILVDGWLGTGGYYLAKTGLPPFSEMGNAQIVGLLTLTYVPNLFDILTMYIVILALMPIVAALAMESRTTALLFVAALYLAASQPWIAASPESGVPPFALFGAVADALGVSGQALFRFFLSLAVTFGVGGLLLALVRTFELGPRARIAAIILAGSVFAISKYLWFFEPLSEWRNLDLGARPWDDSTWFFNPFAWQLIFFTGFAFANGWLPAPPIDRRLMWLAAVILLISIPLDPDGRPAFRLLNAFETLHPLRDALREVRADLAPIASKSYFGLLRFIHFLALAYLVWALAGDRGANLPSAGWGERVVRVIRRVGQQSLAVFVMSIIIGRMLGVWLRETASGSVARPHDPNAYPARAFDPDFWHTIAANLTGFALIILVAYVARFFRRQPWKAPGQGEIRGEAKS